LDPTITRHDFHQNGYFQHLLITQKQMKVRGLQFVGFIHHVNSEYLSNTKSAAVPLRILIGVQVPKGYIAIKEAIPKRYGFFESFF
jgi:hypothetical protein